MDIKRLVLIVLILIQFWQASTYCFGPISMQEYDGLYSIFYDTSGGNWNWRSEDSAITHWSFPSDLSDPCTNDWQGLNCFQIDGGSCAVVGLDLSHMNLIGRLPSGIQNLTSLNSCSLGNNKLFGSIEHFFFPVSLTRLDLHGNNFTGVFPISVVSLNQLQYLDISMNMLNGKLPVNINSLSSLKRLDVHDNKFCGSIPPQFGTMLALRNLDLGLNQISGTIPTEMMALTNLNNLDLHMNRLGGQIPENIGNLTNISTLVLASNDLTGTIPRSIGD